MATKAIQQESTTEKLIDRWENVGQKLEALAAEVPENNFEYRPADGVRSFADVLRHVAFWNLYVADRVQGKKGDETANEIPKQEFSTKKQILSALERSNTDVLGALKEHKSDLTSGTVEMLLTFIEHSCEHYGQLVVYARMNGIVPPASRG